MSVDTYDCACCNYNGVYEEYIACCEYCGKRICADCLINTLEKDNRPFLSGYKTEDEEIKKQHCPFCSGEKVSDSQRLSFLLGYLNNIAETFHIPLITIEDIDKDIIDKRKNK